MMPDKHIVQSCKGGVYPCGKCPLRFCYVGKWYLHSENLRGKHFITVNIQVHLYLFSPHLHIPQEPSVQVLQGGLLRYLKMRRTHFSCRIPGSHVPAVKCRNRYHALAQTKEGKRPFSPPGIYQRSSRWDHDDPLYSDGSTSFVRRKRRYDPRLVPHLLHLPI